MDFTNERERGKIPLSIGTSLAFESLLNIHDDLKHKVEPYRNVEVIWINVKTLFRNLWGAIPRLRHDLVSDMQLAEALMFEIEMIKDVCRNECNGVEVVFYTPNYYDLEHINKEVLLKLDNTELQKNYTKRMLNTLQIVLKKYNAHLNPDIPSDKKQMIRIFKNQITDRETRKAFIITSYAYDLTAYRKFSNLKLLETHTGAIKGRELWYTKYENHNAIPPMPFRLDLLTILGDKTLFRTKVPKFRQTIIELAKEHRWTPLTTADKIRYNINSVKDYQIRHRLLDVITGM